MAIRGHGFFYSKGWLYPVWLAPYGFPTSSCFQWLLVLCPSNERKNERKTERKKETNKEQKKYVNQERNKDRTKEGNEEKKDTKKERNKETLA